MVATRRLVLSGVVLASALALRPGPVRVHPGTPPALIGRCTAPDGSVADTPCVDDGDCPEGHSCSVTAFRRCAVAAR